MPQIIFDTDEAPIELRGDAVTVGRSPDCDIRLDDTSVSSHHAVLERQDGQYHVKDLGSTNGIMVNAKRVTSAALTDGDRVSFGGVAATYRGAAAPSNGADESASSVAAKFALLNSKWVLIAAAVTTIILAVAGFKLRPKSPEVTLRRYLDAKDVEHRSRYVRNSDRVRSAMQAFYTSHPLTGNDGKIVRNTRRNRQPNVVFLDVLSAAPGRHPEQFALVETPEGYKVDWEEAVGYNPMSAHAFAAKLDTSPTRFRVLAQLDSYYNYEFASARATHYSVRLLMPSEAAELHGYVLRDSEEGRGLFDHLQDGKQRDVVLDVRHPAHTGNGYHVEIVRFVQKGWLILDSASPASQEDGRQEQAVTSAGGNQKPDESGMSAYTEQQIQASPDEVTAKERILAYMSGLNDGKADGIKGFALPSSVHFDEFISGRVRALIPNGYRDSEFYTSHAAEIKVLERIYADSWRAAFDRFTVHDGVQRKDDLSWAKPPPAPMESAAPDLPASLPASGPQAGKTWEHVCPRCNEISRFDSPRTAKCPRDGSLLVPKRNSIPPLPITGIPEQRVWTYSCFRCGRVLEFDAPSSGRCPNDGGTLIPQR